MRRYSIHLIASRGRFFKAGEPIPDDVSVPPFAEKRYRIPDEQPDESDPRKSTTASSATTTGKMANEVKLLPRA